MTMLTIDYSALQTTANLSRRLSSDLGSYGDRISTSVISRLHSLPGSDDAGYVGAAARGASNKIVELMEKKTRAQNFGTNLERFVSEAKAADRSVAKDIKITASHYVGKRSMFQKIGDWIYGTFCVDFANSDGLTKLIADCVKYGRGKVSAFVESVHDWIKYKGGKYVWNSVKAVALAVAGVVSAVVAVVTAGTALAIAAAAAACVLAVIGIINGVVSVVNNIKAKNQYDEGKLGQARYYGNIEKFSDAVDKYDMGDKAANKSWHMIGKTVDAVETGCDIVTGINGVANFLGVKDADGIVRSYEFTTNNLTKNLKNFLGFSKKRYSVDPETGKLMDYMGERSGYKVREKWSFKDMLNSRKDGGEKQVLRKYFGFGSSDKIFYKPTSTSRLSKQFQRLNGFEKAGKTTLDAAGVVSKTMKRIESVDNVAINIKNGITWENAWDTSKDIVSLFDFVDIVDKGKDVMDFAEDDAKVMQKNVRINWRIAPSVIGRFGLVH